MHGGFSLSSRRASASLWVRTIGFDGRVERARCLDHLAHVQRVGRRNHQHCGLCDVRLDQHVGLDGIA